MSGLCKVEMPAFLGAGRPMEEERIALSANERERFKVLHEVREGHVRQIDAARRLRLSDRQVRRLLERLREAPRRCFVSSHKDIIRDSASLAPCALRRAHQATSSNRLQYEGARDRSQYERVSRQSTRRPPT